MELQELLREQARECICGKLGHSWKFVLPLQARDATREVLCGCSTCQEQEWQQLPEKGYQQLLKDNAKGKIK